MASVRAREPHADSDLRPAIWTSSCAGTQEGGVPPPLSSENSFLLDEGGAANASLSWVTSGRQYLAQCPVAEGPCFAPDDGGTPPSWLSRETKEDENEMLRSELGHYKRQVVMLLQRLVQRPKHFIVVGEGATVEASTPPQGDPDGHGAPRPGKRLLQKSSS